MIPVSSLVRKPKCWTTVENLNVGDLVTSPESIEAKITQKDDQPKKKVYKITFSDGRVAYSTVNHLWKVSTDKKTKLVSLLNIKKHIVKYPEIRLSVPIPVIDDCEDAELSINPYTLGALLVIGTAVDYSDSGVHNDSIPQKYLNASYKQRLELLRGILDSQSTDISGTDLYIYTQHYQLALDMQYLARSLGCCARLDTVVPDFKSNHRVQYKLTIEYDRPVELFKLYRKRELVRNINADVRLYIDKVEYSHIEKVACICIDNPDRLIITGDFITTITP